MKWLVYFLVGVTLFLDQQGYPQNDEGRWRASQRSLLFKIDLSSTYGDQ
jgi:hypothetical protein